MDEGVEISFPFYNPCIQKIEVLLHQRWQNEIPGKGMCVFVLYAHLYYLYPSVVVSFVVFVARTSHFPVRFSHWA